MSVVIVAALIGASGCQREMSTREYEHRMDQAARGIDGAVRALGSTSPAPSDPDRFIYVADALDRATETLRSIDPPHQAARAHQQLERSTSTLAGSMRTLAKRLQDATTDQARLDLIQSWLDSSSGATALRRIAAALSALDRNGYHLTQRSSAAQ